MVFNFVLKLASLGLSILIALSCWTSNLFTYIPLVNSFNEGHVYDYIVVGGGAAGSVIAGRLAENGFEVLLLEAGGPPPWWATVGMINMPVLGPLWQRTAIDWSFITQPQEEACGALYNRASLWPRGRVLGGSARLNNMVYLRGHHRDWQEWGISHSEMLHYFRKSEKQLGSFASDVAHHSTEGWLPVSDMPLITKLADAVISGAQELGYLILDLNQMMQTGFMRAQTTSYNGSRFTADCAFLYNDTLKNLRILSNTLVNKVNLNSKNEATGVQFYHGSKWLDAKSRHGVVISAGAIGSPKILLQSGIGPVDHLSDIGVDVRVPLPNVGKNLLDHIGAGADLVFINSTLSVNLEKLIDPLALWKYATNGSGPFSHSGCEVTGLLHTQLVNHERDPPDIQIMVIPAGPSSDKGTILRHNIGISDKVWEEYFSTENADVQDVGVTIMAVLLHPRSKGEIKLRSQDPFESPIIDPRYLTDPKDVETLVEGIFKVKEILQTKAMSKLGAYLNPKRMPTCDKYPFDSRNYWRCYVRMLTLTIYHPAGTCQMRSSSDSRAVVDPSFRVIGTKKLYVADASVMPTLPSANILAAITALAEKAADIILHEGTTIQEKKKLCVDMPLGCNTSNSIGREEL